MYAMTQLSLSYCYITHVAHRSVRCDGAQKCPRNWVTLSDAYNVCRTYTHVGCMSVGSDGIRKGFLKTNCHDYYSLYIHTKRRMHMSTMKSMQSVSQTLSNAIQIQLTKTKLPSSSSISIIFSLHPMLCTSISSCF